MSDPAHHALFLRAINTGTRRVRNDQLVDAQRVFGMHDVAAYQAAGNLTFRAFVQSSPTERALVPVT